MCILFRNNRQYITSERDLSVLLQEYEQELGFPSITPITPRGLSTLVKHFLMIFRIVV